MVTKLKGGEFMENRWILVIDGYEGIRKSAINLFNGYVAGLVPYVLPIKMVSVRHWYTYTLTSLV